MRHAQSHQRSGNDSPAEYFGRVARTIPAPFRLACTATESANAPCLSPSSRADATDAHARRSRRGPGSGGPACGQITQSAALDGFTPHGAARTHRGPALGALLRSGLNGAAALLHAWRERYRRHIDAHSIHRDLSGLDTRTLRDLGIHHRGELRFIARRLAHGEDLHEFNGQR